MSYSFKNLAIKGGGIRGIAYLGALEVLDQKGILKNIEKVSGASAGAITALLVALNHDFESIKKIANSLDYTKVPGEPSFFRGDIDEDEVEITQEQIDDAASRGIGHTNRIVNLFKYYGIHTSDYIYDWFKEQIESVVGKPDVTFKDFKEAGCKDLYIAVTNISSHSSIMCSYETTPELEVAEAVRVSMTIPIFFEAIDFDNIYLRGYFGDGGVMNNFPLQYFDTGIAANPETLGLFLYGKDKPQVFPKSYKLTTFAGDIVASLLVAQDWHFARVPQDVQRAVQIWDCGISATDFSITAGSEPYNKLYASGKEAALDYFEHYDKGDFEYLRISKFKTEKG